MSKNENINVLTIHKNNNITTELNFKNIQKQYCRNNKQTQAEKTTSLRRVCFRVGSVSNAAIPLQLDFRYVHVLQTVVTVPVARRKHVSKVLPVSVSHLHPCPAHTVSKHFTVAMAAGPIAMVTGPVVMQRLREHLPICSVNRHLISRTLDAELQLGVLVRLEVVLVYVLHEELLFHGLARALVAPRGVAVEARTQTHLLWVESVTIETVPAGEQLDEVICFFLLMCNTQLKGALFTPFYMFGLYCV